MDYIQEFFFIFHNNLETKRQQKLHTETSRIIAVFSPLPVPSIQTHQYEQNLNSQTRSISTSALFPSDRGPAQNGVSYLNRGISQRNGSWPSFRENRRNNLSNYTKTRNFAFNQSESNCKRGLKTHQ